MRPIVTPDEMRAIDASAAVPVEELIERAGGAVARAAVRLLGGTYGRTVDVIVGPGNNGADGRVAARILAAQGVRVRVHDAALCPPRLAPTDLVIDAAYGTGFRGTWSPPAVGSAPVLAVDIPSGVDGLTGAVAGSALAAGATVTFAAWKPGLVFPPGRELAGRVEVADIGLAVGGAGAQLLERADVVDWLPTRQSGAHKWQAALYVVAGSPSMPGAAALVAAGALRSGAGMVHVSSPGVEGPDMLPVEAVRRPLPSSGWERSVLESADRFHAMVLGPGLGRADDTGRAVCVVLAEATLPVVVDGDALFAVGQGGAASLAALRRRGGATVLTPHDGEYELLTGERPGPDRLAAARRLAERAGSVVLLKGPTTVVADPSGQVLVVTSGDERLATAGTGDVLAGVIGALLASGVAALEATAMGAWLHGAAARRCHHRGFIASDLPAALAGLFAELSGEVG